MGNNTGTYVWREGRFIKISDRPPSLGFVTETYMPRLKGRIHRPFNTDHISGESREYNTRRELYADMKRHGVRYANEGEGTHVDRPSPNPKEVERKIAQKLTEEGEKRSFRW